MRKISTSMMAVLCTLAFVSVATAGDDKTKTAPPPKDAAKKAPDTAQVKPKEPPPADPAAGMPAQPTPPPELLAAAKASKGTWFCTGEGFGPDGTAMKMKATMKMALDLDKMWIKGTLSMPKQKGQKRGMKFTSYRTYSAMEKKWHQVAVDNEGGWSKGWSTGPDAAGKVTWEVEGNMAGMAVKMRDYEEPGAKKGQMHFWGEWMNPETKQYVKAYDVTCKK
jgi:hypothetical protein